MTDLAQHIVYPTQKSASRIGTVPGSAWRLLGGLGVVLALVGGLDVIFRWYPAAFRSTEWEFGTTAITVASLPLLSIGLVVLLISALARDQRSLVAATGAVFAILAVLLIAVLLLFGLDIPIALQAVTAPGPRTEIMKTIARTLLMGGAFLVLYIAGAVVGLRNPFTGQH